MLLNVYVKELFLINEIEILKLVVKRLASARIPYMVTGSIAANFYTTPRMTRDIDIVVAVEEKDAEALYSLFSSDFYVDKQAIKNAIHNKQIFNIIHNKEVVKVDFIIRKDTNYRNLEFKNRRCLDWEGQEIFVASPEDLILSKLFWARESLSEIQLRDVRNLFRTSPNLDRGYIEKWVRELKLDEVYNEVKM